MNLKKLFFIMTIAASIANAQLEVSKFQRGGRDKYESYSLDLKTLNELNEFSKTQTQQEVNDNWRAFLSTAHLNFQAPEDNKSLNSGLFGASWALQEVTLQFAGQLSPQLLNAIVQTYAEDVKTLLNITPNSMILIGKDPMGKAMQAMVVYNCLTRFAILPDVPLPCENLQARTRLSTEKFEEMKSAFIRVIRSGVFQFQTPYCEALTDPSQVALGKSIFNTFEEMLDIKIRDKNQYDHMPSAHSGGMGRGKLYGPMMVNCKTRKADRLAQIFGVF